MNNPDPESSTPLAGQQRCSVGHLCSGADSYCRTCGVQLPSDEADREIRTDGAGEVDGELRLPIATARSEILGLAKNGTWDRDDLLEHATRESDLSAAVTERALESLLSAGELYQVEQGDGTHEVHRT